MTGEPSSEIKVLLVLPGPGLRSGIRQLLINNDHQLSVDEATTPDEALASFGRGAPDVALLDAQMPANGGFALCRQLVELRPELPVLLLTALDWDSVLTESWKAGAVGVLTKDADADALVQAVRQAAEGRRLFTSEQRRKIRIWEHAVGGRLAALTVREWDVLRLIAKGKTNREICEELVLSPKTIEKHVSSILSKSGLRFRTELVAFLLEHHLEI